ncbi:hypothetical protein GOODEAATRI_020688 [Goodea atripinnis]|uniref:Uncharacterized protein n=1 Tax=Goodea atripinnis TaxID=208336 RepID=A0ABV0NWB8_9TELE
MFSVASISAHFHHVIELLRFRQGTLSGIFLSAVFQFSYTAVFGAYTAFIFIRTGEGWQEKQRGETLLFGLVKLQSLPEEVPIS